jgi:hypothetical protein
MNPGLLSLRLMRCPLRHAARAQNRPIFSSHPNVVAICQTKPEIVTVTEQRQLCAERTKSSDAKKSVTTKICVSYADGSWFCKNLVKNYWTECCDCRHVFAEKFGEIMGILYSQYVLFSFF